MAECEVAGEVITPQNEDTTPISLECPSTDKLVKKLPDPPQQNGDSPSDNLPTVNGFSEEMHDDLLAEIDQIVSDENGELSSLKLQISGLESANKCLEDKLAEISQQKEEEIKRCKVSISEGEVQCETLQKTVASQLNEINSWKEKVDSNDKAARKAIAGYKAEHKANIDKITKKYNECKSEKESMVVKYAQGEAKIAQLQSNTEKLEIRLKDKEREKEILAEKLRNLKSESAKQSTNAGAKVSELAALKQELESQKESISSHEYRTKWAQNKLRSEVEAHKETKLKLEETTRRFKESKEECITIRNNCQEMIKTYQESEEIKSNSLDIELKRKDAELREKSVALSEAIQNLESLKAELNKTSKAAEILRRQSGAGEVKVEELEKTNNLKKKELNDLNACTMSLREENSQIRSKLQEMQSLHQELELKDAECLDMQSQVAAITQSMEEYNVDMEACKKRDGEMLALTQKMTERNAELQSENSALKSKLDGVGFTSGQQEDQIAVLQESVKQQEKLLEIERSAAQSTLQTTQNELADYTKTIEKLNSDIDGYQTEVKMLKKKQVSSVKELTREVHTLRRQLEAHESKHLDENIVSSTSLARQNSPARDGSTSLQHSRANSVSSLDKQDSWAVVERQQTPPESSKPQSADGESLPPTSDSLDPQFLEPDKQKMIEKIVKLQKLNARKNEKLDFCQEHISQLIEEVQRKTRIIQMYAMKDHVSGLSSDAMERNKSSIAKKGGIMSSISNQQSKDESLNLKLSLKINNQLQALFEDTLLKNITLKENMDTLGREIERMAVENASLRDQISRHEAEIT